MFLEQLGVYGWQDKDEDLLLASLVTGDPLLLIGKHGNAKTHVANKIAHALALSFLSYDASKAMFDDILGYPNMQKLKNGVVEYVSSPITIWDKQLILIDELNRALPELQSKWLEIIRSRKVMGFATQVHWVWAAMNPLTYEATNALDEALIGRFALFLYPPDILDMCEEDRIRVASHLNGDDAPALPYWVPSHTAKTVDTKAIRKIGKQLHSVLQRASTQFIALQEQMETLPEFLARYAMLLARETKGAISLDGRRLGFLYRNLLACFAVQLSKASLSCASSRSATQKPHVIASRCTTARDVLRASIPLALNEDGIAQEEGTHAIESCFDLLAEYFEDDGQIERVYTVYELFTTSDVIRRATLLLTADLEHVVLCKAWTDIIASDTDMTLLAYTALQVETHRPGTVPQELLSALSEKVDTQWMVSTVLPMLSDDGIDFIADVEALVDQATDLGKLVAFHRVKHMVETQTLSDACIAATRQQISDEVATLQQLIGQQKGA